jgi:hypothetical protein
MNDLISRQAVIENIRKYADKKCCNGEIELANGILKSLSIIKKQPTAYDVDKVVEQLQQMKTRYFLAIANTGNETLDKIYEDVGNSIDKAIEIVKGAVKDE